MTIEISAGVASKIVMSSNGGMWQRKAISSTHDNNRWRRKKAKASMTAKNS